MDQRGTTHHGFQGAELVGSFVWMRQDYEMASHGLENAFRAISILVFEEISLDSIETKQDVPWAKEKVTLYHADVPMG